MIEEAKKYRSIGWNVIPLFQNTKNPKFSTHVLPNSGWKQFETRMSTDEEFFKMFSAENITGIALVCGKTSGVMVVDEDNYKENGLTFSQESSIVVNSANSGRHLYFKYNEEVAQVGLKKDVYIEIKSQGGIVVLPPSQVIKKDGATIGTYTFEKWGDVKYLPEISLEALKIIKPTTTRSVSLTSLIEADLGTQHNNLRDLANKILYRYNEEDWDRFAYEQIRKEASLFSPPHPTNRVEAIIRDCSAFVSSKKKEKEAEEKSIKSFVGTNASEEYKKRQIRNGIGISTTFDELDKYFLFVPGNVYLFAGITGIGKTTFAMNLISRIASTGVKVSLLSAEMGLNSIEKVESIVSGEVPETLEILETNAMISVRTLFEHYENNGIPDIVFIDHIHFMKREKKTLTESLDIAIHEIQSWATKLNVPVVVISHLRKLNMDREPNLDDIKDSQALAGVPSVLFFIYRKRLNRRDKDNFDVFSKIGKIIIEKNRLYNPSKGGLHTGRVTYTMMGNKVTMEPLVIQNVVADETRPNQTVIDASLIFN